MLCGACWYTLRVRAPSTITIPFCPTHVINRKLLVLAGALRHLGSSYSWSMWQGQSLYCCLILCPWQATWPSHYLPAHLTSGAIGLQFGTYCNQPQHGIKHQYIYKNRLQDSLPSLICGEQTCLDHAIQSGESKPSCVEWSLVSCDRTISNNLTQYHARRLWMSMWYLCALVVVQQLANLGYQLKCHAGLQFWWGILDEGTSNNDIGNGLEFEQ